MLKKILTLCLVLCMVSLPAFAALDDIAGEKFEKEIGLLYALGIVEGNEDSLYKPADFLTRAEMTTIDLRLLAVDATANATFEDVAPDHWAYKIIGTAQQLGIVNGMSETIFAPGENVTFPQAAKMLVCTLGYGVEAETLGGYPTGYLVKASQLGVTSGVKDDGGPITRATMAKMVANSLDVDLMVRTGFGDKANWEPKEGVNILNEYLDVVVYEGTIDATYTLDLGGAACEEDEVAMKNTIIKVGETNIASFIGRSVTVYAREDEEEETLTALHVEADKNSEIFTIAAEDVLPQTSATELWYDVDGSKEFFEIDANATWVYNGSVANAPVDLTAVNGSITLSANDGEKADIVFVNAYQDAVVEKVNATKGVITFKAPILNAEGSKLPSITLDADNKNVKFSITDKEGKALEVKDLKEWDVLTITMNDDQTLYQIVSHNESVTGKITEYSATEETAVIGDKKYDIADVLVDADGKEVATATKKEGTFYLNYLGKVVALDTEGNKDYKYGYIVAHAEGAGLDANESVKIFTEDGVMEIYNLNQKRKVYAETLVEEHESTWAEIETVEIERLLKYKLNAAGEITELKYMASTKPTGNFIGPPISAWNFKHKVLDTTKIFVVPDEYTGNDALYGFFDHALLTNHASVPNVTVYDLDEEDNVGVALSKGVSATPSTVGVITKVSEALLDDEPVVSVEMFEARVGKKTIYLKEGLTSIEYLLNGFTNEKAVGLRKYSDAEKAEVVFEPGIKGLEVGDVIWFAPKNAEGISMAVQVIMRAHHQPIGNTATSVDNAKIHYCDTLWHTERERGFVFVDKIDSISKTNVSFTSYDRQNAVNESCRIGMDILSEEMIYLYDMESGNISRISPEEILEDDNLCAYRFNFKTILTVAYRNVPASAQTPPSAE